MSVRPTEIIVSHQSTDFDALGSMLAARRLYPQAQVVLHGGLNRNVREFVNLHADELALSEASRVDLGGVTRVVVVETSHLGRLGELAEVVQRPGVEALLFDHHGSKLPGWVDPAHAVTSHDGALSTTMVGILGERGIEPTAAEATALALGIHEDTGSLTYPSTTLRDVEALAFCARHGAGQELIARFLHMPLSEELRALLTQLVDAGETVDVDGIPVMVAAARWPRYVDGISTLAGKITDLMECEALVMLVEMDGRVFVVGRSHTAELDMDAVLEALGGGGHPQAASAIVRGRTLAQVRSGVVRALPGGLVPAPRASAIMSSPIWLVNADTSIQDALEQCRRRHTSGVLVESDGHLTGVAGREDLGRAIGHGLAHAPVRGVMSASPAAVALDASLTEVRRALLRAGRVAVTDEGGAGPHRTDRLLGVITRGDRCGRYANAIPSVMTRPSPIWTSGWGACRDWSGCGMRFAPPQANRVGCTSWAAPCATCCCTSPTSTSTWPWRGTAWRLPAGWRDCWMAGCTPTRSSTRRWCWPRTCESMSPPPVRSTTSTRRRCRSSSTRRSARTCTAATSPSTRWRWRSNPAGSASWSTPTADMPIFGLGACGCCTTSPYRGPDQDLPRHPL